MSTMMHPTRRDDLLKRVDRPSPARAGLLNAVESGGKLLRLAIMRAGLSQKEAQDALGVEDKGQFSRMLDGKEKLGIHQCLRIEAVAIWREIIFLSAEHAGCEIERVIKIKERA